MNNEQELLERISKQTPIVTVRDRRLDGLKPVVPQFVADWYEDHKDNFELSVQSLCVHGCEPVRKIDAWFDGDNARPIETLVMMHKFGYKIEREKLYTVEIPNPRSSVHYVLRKGSDDQVYIDCYVTPKWRDYKSVQLTEAEIKEDFEWALQFKKEVK